MTTLTPLPAATYHPAVVSDETADASVLERYAVTFVVLLVACWAVYAAQGPIVGAFTKIATGLLF